MHEYFAAWRDWSQGRDVTAYPLWWHTVRFYARLGKAAEFAAALSIVVEIIGPARLHRVGRSLGKRGTTVDTKIGAAMRDLDRRAFRLVVWASLLGSLLLLALVDRTPRPDAVLLLVQRDFVALLREVLIEGGKFALLTVVFYFALYVFGGEIVIAFRVAERVLAFAIIGMARLLEREDLGMLIKVGSVVLLVVGFHFDFLGS